VHEIPNNDLGIDVDRERPAFYLNYDVHLSRAAWSRE
jgi:hypothetical protein